MPWAGSRPIGTSQNVRFDCTPSPSTYGQVICAGSTRSGVCAAGRAGVRRRVWAAAPASAATAATIKTTARRPALLIDACHRGLRHRGHAGRTVLDQLEELHPRPGVVAKD